jgi:hypothetical protein
VTELLAAMLAFILCYLAFALLALCQAPHRKAVDPLASSPSRRGQFARMVVAVACLATALLVLLAAQGNGFGTLLWVLLTSASAMFLSFTLSWRPGWLRLLSSAPGSRRANS